MRHETLKWPIAIARLAGPVLAITILTERAVYGAETNFLPDGFTGPALIGAAFVYMAKTIYELVIRRKDPTKEEEDPRLNAAAWQMLIQHMDREEKLFEQLAQAQDRTTAALTQLTLRIDR